MIVVDSTVLIDVLRDDRSAIAWLRGRGAPPLCSEVTRTEILRGMRSSERSGTLRLLDAVDWLAVDDRISSRAGELGRRFRRSHGTLGVADLLIAATALEHGAELATRNVRHFPMFAGLEAPY